LNRGVSRSVLTGKEPKQLGRIMPRYLVERTFDMTSGLPGPREGNADISTSIDTDRERQVVWVQSFVTPDKGTSFCIFDGPSPDAVRAAAGRTGLPVRRVTEVRELDRFFYASSPFHGIPLL
jgi:hypothetical protein